MLRGMALESAVDEERHWLRSGRAGGLPMRERSRDEIS